ILKRSLILLVLMLSPVTPHIADEMGEMLGAATIVSQQKWPLYSDALAREEQVEIIIQINGKVRAKVLADEGIDEEALKKLGQNDTRVAPLLEGKKIMRIIVVPKKLVNIVVA